MSGAPDFDRIKAAEARLDGHVRRTPLLSAPALDALAGRRVLIKAECLQHTGSFKARGGWAAVSALPAAVRARGVIACSSGNHAQGVARAAAAHGTRALIVMPGDAPAPKVDNTRALGAEVVFYDRAREDRDGLTATLAERDGLTLIKPYDDTEVIAGQATTGLEIAAQAAAEGVHAAEVLVCCGGGGLSAGIALALAETAPRMRVRPVEPDGFDDMARSLAAGTRLANSARDGSICDAILTPMPGEITFPVLASRAGPGLVVTEGEVLRTMALAFQHLKLVLEPGGAVALAAALFRPDALSGDTVIAVATGGNVSAEVFARALSMPPTRA
ncbi:threonine/serine dehydratase [Dinoroseobacter sp. PD6]|uniref:threonine ammonia-lyase n=1 Tax=Dinoroseobacter sp. PD6 TaxID=3028384 RepID=UPI00237A69BC|nr:threonine/serine dehydratase [Dinoroseobacter sp. PD6]MDD9717602.1 threonine/serine dehydratase [Dinoroseobacter sp. PD6]